MERGAVRRVLLSLWVLVLGSAGSGAGSGVGSGTGSGARSGTRPLEDYQVHMETVRFDKAMEGCSGDGRLAELSTEQEAQAVLRGLEARLEGSGPQAFWVGLRRSAGDCVVSNLPLQGYRWQSDGNQRWTGSPQWWEEPSDTCILTPCAALKVQRNGTGLTRWGFKALSCKDSLAFICKRTRGPSDDLPPISSTVGTEPPTSHTPSPPTTSGPQTEPSKVPATGPCPKPSIPRSRWLTSDPWLLVVTCWSRDEWKFNCSEGRWVRDGSVLDPDTVCPETPTTTPPETTPSPLSRLEPWAWILMVVVAVVVLLVVLLVVLVRFCLVRRSRDRAVRKAEKMAMKNKEAGRLHGDDQ